MDLENLTIQELVKIEGFAERCQVARRYPLTMMMLMASRDRSLAEIVDKLPSILVCDEEQWITQLAGLEADGEQNTPAKKAEEKPASSAKAEEQKEQKPADEPAPAPDAVKAAAKPAAKPAEGRGAGRPPKTAAVAAGDIPDFDKLTNPELRDFCVKHSVISRIKKDMGNSKRESMIAWCKQHFSASAAAPAEPAVAPAAEPAEAAAKPAEKAEEKPAAEPPSPYDGLSAKELFCICKERGLTVAEKQSADVYHQALSLDDIAREAHEAKEAAEAQKAVEPAEKEAIPDITAVPVPEADEAEDFDDWDDAEPAKAEPAKEQEAAADDDDDDWDI